MVAAKGNSAPGAPDTTFNTLGDAFVNASGKVAFASTLAGVNSHGGTDNGIWTTMKTPAGGLQLAVKSNDVLAGFANGTVATMAPPLINEDGHILTLATMKTGPGVTAVNNKWIMNQATTGAPVFYGSSGLPLGGVTKVNGQNPVIATINELVQSNLALSDNWAMACGFKLDAATGTTASNDSGVIRFTGNGSSADGVREGTDTIPGTSITFGQMTGRVAYHYQTYLVSAASNDVAAKNQVIVHGAAGGVKQLIAQKGMPVNNIGGQPIPGVTCSAFIGEMANGKETIIFRATLAGKDITTANNEAICMPFGAAASEILAKGMEIETGVTIASFINVWGISAAGRDDILALVKLTGKNVTAANDQALILFHDNLSIQILMREGEPAQGAGTGTIGVISRVEVDPYNGYYAILCTLAGAPAGTDQALYTGYVGITSNSSLFALHRPVLHLRKGWQYDGQPGKIRSISLPSTVPASGVGGTGRSRALSNTGFLALTVEFDNGARQVVLSSVE